MIDGERMIYRLVSGAVVTTIFFTALTGDFETPFGILSLYACMLFAQEGIVDFYREARAKIRRYIRKRRRMKRHTCKTIYMDRERMEA